MTRQVRTPSPQRQVQLVFQRTLRDGLRNAPLAFVAPTMFAGFVAIMFTAVFEAVADTPGFPTRTFIEWIGPATVLLTAFVGAGYGAGALLRDIETGYLDRLRILPARPAALITGRALFEAVRIIPPATIVLVATIGLGVDNRNGVIGLAVLLGATVLVAAMWNGIFFLVALKSQDHTAVLGLQPLFMPIVMFSTFFAPTDAMPGWFKTVVNLNPFTHVLTGARSVLAADADLTALAVGLGAFVAIGTITFVTSATTFRGLVGND